MYFSFVRMLLTVDADQVFFFPGVGMPSEVSTFAIAYGERPCRNNP